MKYPPEVILELLSGMKEPKRLGEMLVDQQVISQEELDMALIYQKAQPGKRLGTILRELELVTSLDFMEALTNKMQVVKRFSEN